MNGKLNGELLLKTNKLVIIFLLLAFSDCDSHKSTFQWFFCFFQLKYLITAVDLRRRNSLDRLSRIVASIRKWSFIPTIWNIMSFSQRGNDDRRTTPSCKWGRWGHKTRVAMNFLLKTFLSLSRYYLIYLFFYIFNLHKFCLDHNSTINEFYESVLCFIASHVSFQGADLVFYSGDSSTSFFLFWKQTLEKKLLFLRTSHLNPSLLFPRPIFSPN